MKKMLKSILSEGIGCLQYALYNKTLQNGLTIFLYHDVGDHPSRFNERFDLNVTPAIFDFQIKTIKDYFNIIDPDTLLTGNIPERAAMVTFDDGLQGYFSHALPILEKYKVPSLSFLNMATIKGEMMWAGAITFLTQDEDFLKYYKKQKGEFRTDFSMHLQVDHEIVDSYLKQSGRDITDHVKEYVGPIASEEMVHKADSNPLVYYGNHLYNHDIAVNFSDMDLLASYQKNKQLLESFSSYRDIFSFPYGQPETSFTMKQAELLIRNGAKIVFYSWGQLNHSPFGSILDRLPLSSFESSTNKIKFRLFRKRQGQRP